MTPPRRRHEPDLAASGPIRTREELEAIERATDRRRAAARLRRALASVPTGAPPGPLAIQVVFALVRLADRSSDRTLRAFAQRLTGSPRAIVEAAAYYVQNDWRGLCDAAHTDATLARFATLPFGQLPRVPSDADELFSLWIDQLRRAASGVGASAYRAYLGDVAEAAYRAVALGARPAPVFSDEGRAFFVDALTAELPGTTDFLAARGMVWLLGVLAPNDDAARSAIERARSRFRNAAFTQDCQTILEGSPWPPKA